ncbi:hypothetical protein [Metamycoplasma canadense]|uniref:Uncharacterized protein n=1 Tax=Metamycoplasma canadense TaxID=29554 RepID=A0A077LBN1_9BACT|nr:hypothetical protein [Metamycoplasma canadense]BAP39534.1 hypothetical protein MCAN360_0350 [Metamycoplasma canadense]
MFITWIFKNKIKFFEKKINFIENKINELKTINTQFYEISKHLNEYKILENETAKKIVNFEQKFNDLLINFNDFKNNKKLDKSNYLCKKINRQIKEFFIIFKNNYYEILSKKITNLVNFINLILNKISEIKNKLNKNNYLIDSDDLQKKIIFVEEEIWNQLEIFKTYEILRKNNFDYNQNKKQLITKLDYFKNYIIEILGFLKSIKNNIEIPADFLKNIYQEKSDEFKEIFNLKINDQYFKNIKEAIKKTKNIITENDFFWRKKKLKSQIKNLSKLVNKDYELIKKKIELTIIYKKNFLWIKNAINWIKQNKKCFISKKNDRLFQRVVTNISYFFDNQNMGSLSFLECKKNLNIFKKNTKIIIKTINLIEKKSKQKRFFFDIDKINDEYLKIFELHNFDYPLNNQIIELQNIYQIQIKNKNPDLNLINKLILLIKLKIVRYNLKIKISKHIIENFYSILNDDFNMSLLEKKYDEIFTLYASNNFDECIKKIMNLIKEK